MSRLKTFRKSSTLATVLIATVSAVFAPVVEYENYRGVESYVGSVIILVAVTVGLYALLTRFFLGQSGKQKTHISE